jgi:hypothetical protein
MARPSLLQALLLALALAVISYIVTHLLPIRGGLRQVMMPTGSPLLDQVPSFSAEEVYARIAAFGAQGRELYRRFTLTTDIIFPLTWMPFLFLYARFACSRLGASPAARLLMLVLPAVYLIADIVENVFVWIMLTDFPAPHPFLGGAMIYPTAAKWLALISALLLPTAMIIAWRARSFFVGSDSD